MTMTALPVETSGENELAAIAAELERYWSEQWRRAKEICDLLEQRLAAAKPKTTSSTRPQLRLVGPASAASEPGATEPSRPPLKLLDA